MGEKITLKIAKREVLDKKVKTLRRQGITPGVVYGAGMEAVPIQAEAGEVHFHESIHDADAYFDGGFTV